MFLFGMLSSPLPYLLMAVFYFFGLATGMFAVNTDSQTDQQIQVKNIQVEPQTKSFELAKSSFKFHDYFTQEKVDDKAVQSYQQPVILPNENLIFFVHDIKVHQSPTSEYYFSRPPPTCS